MAEYHKLTIGDADFLLDGAPFRILAGAIHYFRVPREYWRDRLTKLKACGFNTVETYVAWNAHMPREDVFLDEGMLDIAGFLREAQKLGLWAIVRPGPYICSEWEFGALPWWLLKRGEIPLRCLDERFMQPVRTYLDALMRRITPMQSTRGGNIIMMQLENEYGSFGDDKDYLRALRTALCERGLEVPLFTSDGDADFMLTGGTLEDVHKTINFGSRAREQFRALRARQPRGPLMCAEFWNGWFDHWGEAHHSRSSEDAARALDDILAQGASVSAYMFHGGTNFGFMNGANCPSPLDYQPTVSSYDDDAPLNECGDVTPKYKLFREVLAKYAPAGSAPEPAPEPAPKRKYGLVRFTSSAPLTDCLDALSRPARVATPVPMETLGQGYGFILYTARVEGPRGEAPLIIHDARDRAHVFLNGERLGVVYRNDASDDIRLSIPPEGARLDILVENMGRVNYGPYLCDMKGVTRGVRLGQQFLFGWTAYPLPLDDIQGAPLSAGVKPFDGRPVLLSAAFDAGETPVDTFVKLPGFKKGVIFINGKPLSRYWDIGPQLSAYLPAPFMKPGENILSVLELDGFNEPQALLDDNMNLG